MKKITILFLSLILSVGARAQMAAVTDTPFKAGTMYVNDSFSSLDMNYNATNKWNLGINARLGYLFDDDVMALVDGMWGCYQEVPNELCLGAGMRYYIRQNGIFLGAGIRYKHQDKYDDLMPNVNVGYSFFLSRTVTIEPELYYDFSTKNFSDKSGVGLRIGFGIYL